jgi:sec-independent protein translocase protein TatC
MAKNETLAPDPEDMFHETRMSFADHIGELRTHLLRALSGFTIGMIISLFFLGQYVMRIIVAPVEDQLEAFENRVIQKEMKKIQAEEDSPSAAPIRPFPVVFLLKKEDLLIAIGQKAAPTEPPMLDAMTSGIEGLMLDFDVTYAVGNIEKKRIIQEKSAFVRVGAQISNPGVFNEHIQKTMLQIRKPRLSAMHITEAFMVYFKIALMTGLVVSSPWVFYHIWMFIAAGLYPHEKRLVNVYLPFSLFLFLSGVLICQFMVIPKAIEAMLWFNEWLGIGADLRLNEWLGFALMMPLVFGVSFQTPLVMMFLNKVGILSVQIYRDYRRISWFVMAVFAAVITPSVDAFSMLFLWVPMGALYELGIYLCIWQGQQEPLAEWEKEEKANELVEV